MSNNITKLKIVIIGFFVLFIPLFFLCHELDKLYNSTKENLKNDLSEKIIVASSKLKSNLDPYNYLQSEFSKIHASLFPDFQEQVTYRIPDDSYIQNLYSEEAFNNLVKLTKDRFNPIIISFGTNNLKSYFPYYSPDLEKQFESDIDRRNLLYDKAFLDSRELVRKYEEYFESDPKINTDYYVDKYDIQEKALLCYKYLTRFRRYSHDAKKFYTDYFNKQTFYNIIKYSFSKKGIHGYYSLLIPQSGISPDSIIDSVLSDNNNGVKIEFIKDRDVNKNQILETDNGYEFFLDLTTDFSNQIKIYKRIKDKDKDKDKGKSDYLSKIFRLSIDFPNELTKSNNLHKLSNYLALIFLIIYIFASLKFLQHNYALNIGAAYKLILVICLIMFIPITEIGLLIWISSQNLNNIIDHNVAQNLNNELENISVINQENNQRLVASNFELKRKIKKGKFSPEMNTITDGILTNHDNDTWFYLWHSKLVALSEDGEYYSFRLNERKIEKENQNEGLFLRKYANNLNIIKNNNTDLKNELSSSFSLSAVEKYIPLFAEERSVGQESVPHRYIMSFINTRSGTYFFAKDSNNKKYLLLNVLWSLVGRYQYLNSFRTYNTTSWNKPVNKFSNIDLGIALSDMSNTEETRHYPATQALNKDVKYIINKTIEYKDSGQQKITQPDGSIIRQCIFTDDDPFIVGGVAKSNYSSMLHLSVYLVFPILMGYAILLLVLLTRFISVFIKEPVNIYKDGLLCLENNQYGIKIKSFSKDEFDNVTKAFNEMSVAIKQKEQIKRYVSDKLVQSVSNKNIQEAGMGKQEKVTILSSDIRNFTGISEKHEPSVIVQMLNLYFTRMQQVISENGGIIDKYIGDAIQAVFYDEPNKENQVIRAAKAAIGMRKALEEFNKEREEAGLFTIQTGIGIDTDIAITGTIGTEKGRKDFSVNGDVVARAAELEAKTKQTISKILISKKSLDWIATASSKPRNDSLVYEEFDSESVELLDVR